MTFKQLEYLEYISSHYNSYELATATQIMYTLEQTEKAVGKLYLDFNELDVIELINNEFMNYETSNTVGIRSHARHINYYLTDLLHFSGLSVQVRQVINHTAKHCEQKLKDIIMSQVIDRDIMDEFIDKHAEQFDVAQIQTISRNNIHFYTDEFMYHIAQWELFANAKLQDQPLQHITHFLKYLAWNMYATTQSPTILTSHFDFLKAIDCTRAYIGFLKNKGLTIQKGAKYLYDLEYPEKWRLYRELVKGEPVTTHDIYGQTIKINYHQEYFNHLLDTGQDELYECSKRIVMALVPKHQVCNRHSYYFTQQMLKNCIPQYRPQYYPSKQRFRMITYSTTDILTLYHHYGIVNGYFPYLSIDTLVTPSQTD
ncbi:MAG: hypothetical protein BEN18_08715 [Epulopiscium sp. Nuni2H_MBin001]|nr:MAG: hypothetical protein BEN18_08715 [Epulopiscium sp. Nuni2H_MBin001]